MLIEYRVRPVTRYVITRFETSGPDENGRGSGGSSTKGEFDTEAVAYEVGYALCKAEHEGRGWPIGDERIQYPRPVAVSASVGGGPLCANDPNIY